MKLSFIWQSALLWSVSFMVNAYAQTPTQATSPNLKTNQNLYQWVDNYYAASNLEQMQNVLVQIQEHFPQHPLRWELEAYHSRFYLQSLYTINLALKNLQHNSSLDAYPALLHLIQSWPIDQRVDLAQSVLELAQNHSIPAIRAMSAWTLRHRAHYMNEKFLYQEASKALGKILPMSIIGTWDNDQGKGLDTVLPPEEGIDFKAEYKGKLLPIKWRQDYPKDLRDKINFKQLLSPKKWQIAYATTAVDIPQASKAELRISSSDPFKVWVDGKLLMHINQVDGWLFDAFVIPLDLSAGHHQILIKSAQQTGQWMLSARLTGAQGKALNYQVIEDHKVAKVDGKKDAATANQNSSTKNQKTLKVEDVVTAYRAHFNSKMPLRQHLSTLKLLSEAGLSIECLKLAEKLAIEYPKSMIVKLELMIALWQEGERGRTADLLNQLRKQAPMLPLFVYYQSRFWEQQHLDVKSRKLVQKLVEKYPSHARAHQMLADLYQKQGWDEERYHLLSKAYKLRPYSALIKNDLIDAAAAVGKVKQQELLNAELIEQTPYLERYIKKAYRSAKRNHNVSQMIHQAQLCVQHWPQSYACYDLLARAYWRDGQIKQAFATLETMHTLNPLNYAVYKLKGEWLLLLGKEEAAWKAWEEALKRNPNNQSLALRIDKMKPQAPEPWLKDVPTDEEIQVAIKSRDKIAAKEGANSIYLLDDDVTLIKPDGSSIAITTTVTHALNQEGRDDLTKMYVGRSHNTQLLAAYAINPNGQRIEASSIRDGVVRFRQLQIGSTVILQHRKTYKPGAYLAGYITRHWWFHSKNMQVRNSRLVIWRPKDMALHEEFRGQVKKDVQEHGELVRVSWEMNQVDPVITEPRMPPLFSQVFGLSISTVPAWEEVFKWEKELLREAFRMSPEVEKVSDELLKDVTGAQDKIYKIQEYVMRNIRYQQDYEQTIAGVKPHTADQVLSRQYGDCKDKAVLFIALAKKAGLKAHFAIVRTRDAGPVEKKVPSQQFNHAIVYVPKQDGIAEGRFYDPTVDALDVQSLRTDDQGTHALVYNPVSEEHYWQDIPFQASSYNSTQDFIKLAIDADGKMKGELLMQSRGRIAQIIRKQARNPEGFKQVMEYRLNQLFTGAQLLDHKAVEVDDLYNPAQASMSFQHDSWIKREGEQWRIPNAIDWTPKLLFQLKERRYPLVLGHHKEWTWNTEIKLPAHLDVVHIPKDEVQASQCLSLSRHSEWAADKQQIKISWRFISTCEQISAQDYEAHRKLSRQMIQMLNQEIVLTAKKNIPQEKLPSTKNP